MMPAIEKPVKKLIKKPDDKDEILNHYLRLKNRQTIVRGMTEKDILRRNRRYIF